MSLAVCTMASITLLQRCPSRRSIRQCRGDHGWDNAYSDKHGITWQAEPLAHLHDVYAQKRRTPSMPVAVLQHVEQLEHATRKQVGHDHQRQPNVQTPKGTLDVSRRTLPLGIRQHLPQGKHK